LVNTQFEDGSWFVRSRSRPSQPHFDSHFPFGWDQWISAAGTALASASLALTLDPFDTQILPYAPAFGEGEKHAETETEDESFEFDGTRTVDFRADIQPILEGSCLDCHSGDSPKGRFRVTDRTSLIQGGESGVPTFVQGRGEGSQLIRHVTDQVEDMEMPPSKKRKTYPALTPKQVQTLIAWINEGAVWPEDFILEE
jgi:hypothetical protein